MPDDFLDHSSEWGFSSLNFAVTDGLSVIVSRFRSEPNAEPPTLYLAWGTIELM